MPTVREAEKAVAAGSADFEDRLMLLVRSALIQKWEDVFAQLKAMEQFQPDQPGLAWIRVAVNVIARKNEEARQLMQKLADELAQNHPTDEFFLANFLLDQTWQITDHNEYLRMLDRLRPVLDRQPESVPSYYSWAYKRVRSLRSLGRLEEATALQKELAQSAPWDVSAQTAYANDLVAAGDYKAAYAWLRKALDRKEERPEYQTRQLRDTYAEMLRNQGRDEDYLAFMEQWIGTNPTEYAPYQKYLSALVVNDRVDDANKTVKQWLEAARVPEKLEPASLARLNAAVYYALSQRYRISMNWIDPIWLNPLEETAIYFLDHEHHFEIASRIIDNYRFRDTDECDRVKVGSRPPFANLRRDDSVGFLIALYQLDDQRNRSFPCGLAANRECSSPALGCRKRRRKSANLGQCPDSDLRPQFCGDRRVAFPSAANPAGRAGKTNRQAGSAQTGFVRCPHRPRLDRSPRNGSLRLDRAAYLQSLIGEVPTPRCRSGWLCGFMPCIGSSMPCCRPAIEPT